MCSGLALDCSGLGKVRLPDPLAMTNIIEKIWQPLTRMSKRICWRASISYHDMEPVECTFQGYFFTFIFAKTTIFPEYYIGKNANFHLNFLGE